MLGTVVNTLAIIAGGFFGRLISGKLKENLCDTVMQGVGLAVMLIGFSGAVNMAVHEDVNTLVFILSLAVGGLIGAGIDVDGKFNKFAVFAERKLAKSGNNLAKGFVAGSILYCVGTMAVIGSIESGILGKHDVLFAKSMLDGITAVVMGATLGSGVMLSAVSVFIYQSVLTLMAGFVSSFITDAMLTHISVAGGVLVFAIGLNMLNITKIKLANFLPAIFIPVVYFTVEGLLVK